MPQTRSTKRKKPKPPRNLKLEAARTALPSPSGAPDMCMSRRELAEAANAYVWKHTNGQQRTTLSERDIGRYERYEAHWPDEWRRYGLRGVLGASSDAELGFYPNRQTSTSSVTTDHRPPPPDVDGESTTTTGPTTTAGPSAVAVDGLTGIVLRDQFSGEVAGGEVNRREVLVAGAVIAGIAVLAVPGQRQIPDGLAEVASALVGTPSAGGAQRWSPKPVAEDALWTTVTELKGRYQAGRYREVIKALPPLLRTLGDADAPAAGQERWLALAASAYQTACSVLLKLGNQALALLAADRSMTAARRSGDPVTAGASARALAHALAHGGHHELATTVALSAARNVPNNHSATVEDLAVYGALLLRASVIAAANEDRTLAWEAVSEANETAQRIGDDQNLVWTYFCPINVQLHQVSVAVSLGDAGQAIEHARKVDLSRVPLAERRACFWTDVARAYLQWGKYEQAVAAIRSAEQAAPQEVAVRPQVHQVVNELQRRSPPSVQGQVVQLADRIRVAR